MTASVMTFDSLSEDILQYSERPTDDRLAAQIPRIILLAEAASAADLRVLGSELVAEGTLTIGTAVIAKPAYWRSTQSISVFTTVSGQTRQVLKKRTYEYLRTYWPDSSVRGVPKLYADYDYNNLIFAPTPEAALPFEIIYQARLDPLSVDNQTNWTTANAPQLLFYGCMQQVSLFLKNFDKASVWGQRYADALQSLQRENASRSTDRATVKG